jgi:hypothetical protein
MTSIMMIDDGSIPGNTLEEKKQTLLEWYSLNIDKYYEKIEDFTFKTSFIDISPEDVRIWYKYNRNQSLQEEEQIKWDKLLTQLSNEISKFPNGCFFRLNTRSPKDAVDKFPERLEKYLDTHLKSEMTLAEQYLILRQAFIESMRIHSVEEALLLMGASSRILGDFKRALEHEDIWGMKIVIREFVEFDVRNEFRGFYFNGNLNALSQYDGNIFFNLNKEITQDRIIKFMKENGDKLQNSIIDFILTNDHVYICELNPFTSSSGSALFNWKKDEEILKNGPFEFRISETVKDDIYYKLLMGPWYKNIQDSFKRQSKKEMETIYISNTSYTKELIELRHGCSLNLFDDVKIPQIFLFGGYLIKNETLTNELWSFDLIFSKWSLISKDDIEERQKHSSVVYQNKLIIFGGERKKGWYNDLTQFEISLIFYYLNLFRFQKMGNHKNNWKSTFW